MTASAAELIGVHVGQVVPLGFYTSAQTEQPGFGTPEVMPRLRVRARLVGIVVFDNQVVQDDIDRAYGFMVVTPALIRRVVAPVPCRCCAGGVRAPARPWERGCPHGGAGVHPHPAAGLGV